MRTKSYILIFVISYFVSAAIAEITPGPSPNLTGDLGLVIVASHTPEYIEEWLSTPPSHGVTIKRIKTTKPNQLVITAFLVTGFTPNKDGMYSFSVSFDFIGPDKKKVFGQSNYASGSGEMPSKPTFVMADPALDIVLEESDSPGVYTIIGVVEDLVTNRKGRSEYKIQFIND